MNFFISNQYWIIIALFIFALDRITKMLATQFLRYELPIKVFSVLNFSFAANFGAAFGFLNQGSGWQGLLFGGIATVVSLCLIVWLFKINKNKKDVRLKIALALILGGSLGNLYDRIMYGYVIDFLDFYYKQWHYPTFNIADTAICIGAFLLIIDIVCKEKV